MRCFSQIMIEKKCYSDFYEMSKKHLTDCNVYKLQCKLSAKSSCHVEVWMWVQILQRSDEIHQSNSMKNHNKEWISIFY